MGIRSISDSINLYESVFGKGHLSSNGINFDVRCPICAPSDPSKKKLSIRTDTSANHCWVCGWKARTIIPLIKKYGVQKHLEIYSELFGTNYRTNNFVTGETLEKKLDLPKDYKLLTLSSDADPDVKAAWKYVFSRGLLEKDAWYYKIGISNEARWKRRIIMPSFDALGNLNFFVARAIDNNRKPKYDSPDIDKNPIIFNEINLDWSKRLVLVEGAFDLTKCPENSTALLGSDLDEKHEVFKIGRAHV